MARWTPQQVARLAPDQASLSSARRLAQPWPWSETGSTPTLVWGKCQGSGRTPYHVSVDLTGPAFTCTCPSRKHPCKHGLALLLRWAAGGGEIADAPAPQATSEWAAQRQARATAQEAARAARAAGRAPDPAAQQRRLEDRLALMSGGMDDFALWLADLARSGTASARQQGYAWWDAAAARLVDAQLPGLAAQLRDMASDVSSRADWAEHLLLAMGRWWTATAAWRHREDLDEDELGDLRAFVGWSTPSESVRQRPAVHDQWTVLGAHRTDDGRLQQQRTWLHGRASGQTVQVLDFAAAGQVLPVARVVGSVLDAFVACYPGRAVQRALFTEEPLPLGDDGRPPEGGTLSQAHGVAARAWSRNPWAARVPVVLDAVRAGGPAGAAPAAVLVDEEGRGHPVTGDCDVRLLLALTGGAPTTLFGELEVGGLRPLTALVDGRMVPL